MKDKERGGLLLAMKAAGVVLVAVLTFGICFFVTGQKNTDSQKAATAGEKSASDSGKDAAESGKIKKEKEEEPKMLTDEMYSEVIMGNLTKEQLEFVLAAGPEMMSENGPSKEELSGMLNYMAMGHDEIGVEFYGDDNDAHYLISADDINRVLSVITDKRYTEDSSPEIVKGSQMSVLTAGSINVESSIRSADYTADGELWLEYDAVRHDVDRGDITDSRLAKLTAQENGLYQISQIWTVHEEGDKGKIRNGEWDWKMAYCGILADAPGRTYSTEGGIVAEPVISYMLNDMDGDIIPELIVTAASGTEGEGILSVRYSWTGIYTCKGDKAFLAGEDCYDMPMFASDDSGKSLIIYSVDGFNGWAVYYAAKLGKDGISREEIYQGQFPDWGYSDIYNAEHGYRNLELCTLKDNGYKLLESY